MKHFSVAMAKAFGPRILLTHPFDCGFICSKFSHRTDNSKDRNPVFLSGRSLPARCLLLLSCLMDPPGALLWLACVAEETEAWVWSYSGLVGPKSVQIWASGSTPECHHCWSQTQLPVENEMGVNRPPPLEQFGGSEGSV